MKIKLKFLLFLFILFFSGHLLAADTATPSIYSLPLEELMQIKVKTPSSLTATTFQKIPAATLRITKEDIDLSGARNLYELFDIYVPNFEYLRHHFETDPMGLRGLISDRNDNILILVNGHVLNEHTHYGAIGEKNLCLFGDIHHIDVIRGSGSALYGYGAVAMVIDIITDTPETFEGVQVSTQLGLVEESQAVEVKYGQKFSDTVSFLFYSGVSYVAGADQSVSPLIFGSSFDTRFGQDVVSGEPVPYPINPDHATNRDILPIKLFAQLNLDQVSLWSRFSRGGQQFPWNLPISEFPSSYTASGDAKAFDELAQPCSGYQQTSVGAHYDQTLSDNWLINYELSADSTDYERAIIDEGGYRQEAYREDHYKAKVVSNLEIDSRQSVAGGTEFSYERFGLPSLSLFTSKPISNRFQTGMPQWNTQTLSLFGEYQFSPVDDFTFFIGGRFDRNQFTPWLFSPRFATIYSLSTEDTLKLFLTRSARIKFAEDLEYESLNAKESTNPDFLNSVEVRYEKQIGTAFFAGGSSYYNQLDFEDYLSLDSDKIISGQQKTVGVEAEFAYRTPVLTLSASHGYTKLVDFYLSNTLYSLAKDSKPYGYGSDLANWSNHITKLSARYAFNERFSVQTSLRIYWGFPGSVDYLTYQQAQNLLDVTLDEAGKQKLLSPSYFLNLGLSYRVHHHLCLNFTAYNVLGLLYRDANKRFFYDGFSAYRVDAPAYQLLMTYEF